jgi:acyl-CoA dehydrogenase
MIATDHPAEAIEAPKEMLPEHLGGPELSDEQQELRRRVRELIAGECSLEVQREHDEGWRFPYEAWKSMADTGLMAPCVPAEYGGTGRSVFDQALLVEELGRGWFALGEAFATSTFAGTRTLLDVGTEDQRRELLPRFVKGEVRFAFGVTEPSGGTDVLGAMNTYATPDRDGFVINGSKLFTTMADVSDYIVLLARTDPNGQRTEGLSLLLVPASADGVEIRRVPTLGLHSNATNQCFFTDVRVSRAALLGSEGRGWQSLLSSLNNERLVIGALALGNAQAAFEYAGGWALWREAFGRPVGGFQAIQHYISEMATAITTTRLLVYHCAELAAANRGSELLATMAKYQASETGARVTDLGMRIMAGRGYTTEHPMQRYFRDARVFTFGPITNEVAPTFIAQRLGMPRSF